MALYKYVYDYDYDYDVMLSMDGDADAAVVGRVQEARNEFRQLMPVLTSYLLKGSCVRIKLY